VIFFSGKSFLRKIYGHDPGKESFVPAGLSPNGGIQQPVRGNIVCAHPSLQLQVEQAVPLLHRKAGESLYQSAG